MTTYKWDFYGLDPQSALDTITTWTKKFGGLILDYSENIENDTLKVTARIEFPTRDMALFAYSRFEIINKGYYII